MFRALTILGFIALAGAGLAWVADQPGGIVLTWQGTRYETSLVTGFVALLVLVLVISLVWSILRFVFRIPAIVTLGNRMRRRDKALRALTKGMIAAGAGDVRTAKRASMEAARHLPDDPMTLLLKAQTAQLSGDRTETDRAFARMAERDDMRLLGLRGLHAEALRRGDPEAAHHFATQAHELAPVEWAGKAVLEHHATHENWDKALAAIDTNQARKLIDRHVANRQRAVIKTAQAIELGDNNQAKVLELSREAVKLAPDLVPAVVLAGRALSRKGDVRAAGKVLEAGWKVSPHPDIAAAYMDVRHGDSARDRLARAETLARMDERSPESALTLARAALDAREFPKARAAMARLLEPGARPTRRTCLLMADIEETENGSTGALREWLGRAARAPRDVAWIADGIASDTWGPVSPLTGKLDGFEWKVPSDTSAPMQIEASPGSNEPEPPMVQIAPIVPASAPAPASAQITSTEPVEASTDVGANPSATVTITPPPSGDAASGKGLRATMMQSADNDVVSPTRAGGGVFGTRDGRPREVMFAQPSAPDDPGPKQMSAERRNGPFS